MAQIHIFMTPLLETIALFWLKIFAHNQTETHTTPEAESQTN